MIEISRGMIDHYLCFITVGWFDDDPDEPAEKLDEYYEYVMRIEQDAIHRKDLEYLRLGLKYLLCHPEINLEAHGSLYGWEDEEVREIVAYIHSVIWTDSKLNCEEVKDVQLVNTNRFDWWEMRKVEA